MSHQTPKTLSLVLAAAALIGMQTAAHAAGTGDTARSEASAQGQIALVQIREQVRRDLARSTGSVLPHAESIAADAARATDVASRPTDL